MFTAKTVNPPFTLTDTAQFLTGSRKLVESYMEKGTLCSQGVASGRDEGHGPPPCGPRAVSDVPHQDAETNRRRRTQRLGTLSKQAVYDNLHALSRSGLVRQIGAGGPPRRFEARVGDTHHHALPPMRGNRRRGLRRGDALVSNPLRPRLRHRRGRDHRLGGLPRLVKHHGDERPHEPGEAGRPQRFDQGEQVR